MSTYYVIGCTKCKEKAFFLREGMNGFGWMGGADEEIPQFLEKHHYLEHDDAICFFSEYDQRCDDYTTFKTEPEE